ncbi:TPA: hypothetical protein ACH3X3_011152 [Trebouxia sp. C0006]
MAAGAWAVMHTRKPASNSSSLVCGVMTAQPIHPASSAHFSWHANPKSSQILHSCKETTGASHWSAQCLRLELTSSVGCVHDRIDESEVSNADGCLD